MGIGGRLDPWTQGETHHNGEVVSSRLARLVRVLLGALAALVVLVGPARPAAADPPQPTDYLSEVLEVSPPVAGVTVEVVGGDGFLQLTVEEGTEVEVPDYDGRAVYLRFRADGVVEENLSSGASQINDERNPASTAVVSRGEPRWEVVARDGVWAWHDHRIHSMASRVPEAARTPEGVRWTVPIVVDGVAVDIEGRYRLTDAPSPLVWIPVAAVLGLALWGLTRVMTPVSVAGVAVLVGGAAATAAGVAQRNASPPGAPTSALVVVLPVLAVVAGVIVVMQRGRVLRAVAALAGAALVGSWALLRLPVLWRAQLPTDLPFAADRAATVTAAVAAIGAAALVVRSGALAPPPLTAAAPAAPQSEGSGPPPADDEPPSEGAHQD